MFLSLSLQYTIFLSCPIIPRQLKSDVDYEVYISESLNTYLSWLIICRYGIIYTNLLALSGISDLPVYK